MEFYWQKLKEIRKNSGLSVNFVISKMKISRRTYWLWENGRRIPNETNIRTLAKLVGTDISILSDLKPEAPVSKESPDKILAGALNAPDMLYSGILQSIYKLNTQLKQSQTVVNAFLNSVKVLLYIKDINSKYVKVNDYFKETYGLMPEDSCEGKTDNAFFSASEALENSEEDKKVISTGKVIQNRESYIPGTRKKKWGLISKYPLYDPESKILGVVGTFIDITDLKNSERTNALLKEVIDQIDDCIWIATIEDGKENLKYINDAVLDCFGCSKEEFYKNPYIYLDLILPQDKEKFSAFVQSKDYPKTLEYRVKRINDGQEVVLRETVYLNGDVNFSVIRNITSEKKYQDFMALLKFMLDAFSESLALVNLTTKKYLYVNKARELLYERKEEEFLNNDISFWFDQCVYSEDKEIMTYLLSVANEDKPLFYKFRIITPSGKIKFLVEKTTIRKINGEIYAISIDSMADEQNFL